MTTMRTFSAAFRRLATALEALTTSATNQATNIADLSTSLAAVNAKTQRVGASLPTLAVGATDVTVTWPAAWPDTAYGVWVSILAGGGTVAQLHATLKNGTKTVNDCVVTVVNGTGGVVATGIDVLGVRT